VRRVRIERLTVVTPDGATVELATAHRVGGALESQDEVAVSPDGSYLAWTTAEDARLHLRDAKGKERILPRYASGRRMRFSPDGKWLAAITEVGHGDWHKLVAWELATGRISPLVDGEAIGRFEWRADGIIVALNDELIQVSLTGARRTLLTGAHIQRFVAADGGREIVFVDTPHRPEILAIDLEHPERVHKLGVVRGEQVAMAERSPDGSRVVFATKTGLYIIEGDHAPREISSRRDVHSLWFASDGRLAYASTAGATVIDGKHVRRNQTPTRMLRFDKLSGQVMLASDGGELLGWDPATNRKTLIAKTPKGEPLLGAERYQGGVVLWTGREEINGSSQPHRIVRILAITKNGAARELERIDGDRAVDLRSYESTFFTTSTDGRSTAYRGLTGKQFHVLRSDGTDRTIAGWGMLSPTGRHVLVARSEDAKSTTFTLVDSSSGAERGLVRSEQSEWMVDDFSPDGAWLAMTHTLPNRRQALVVFETATGKQRTLLESDAISMSVPWTARGALLVQRAEGLAIASPQGKIRSILDEDIGPGLGEVETHANRVLVCGRSDGRLRSIDLDATSRIVDLEVPNCWTRSKALSPDGEDVVYSDDHAPSGPFQVTSSKGGATPHRLGDGYPAVVFGGRGRLAFESHRGVQVFDGTRHALFETDGPIAAPRFTNNALTFAIGNELVAWHWDTDTKTVLARVPDNQRILTTTPWADGFLLVTVE